jgi:integrase
MSNETKTKTWERTNTPGLLRHRSGTYYARLSIAGKMKFVPLKTKLRAVADVRFADHRARVVKGRKAAKRATAGTGTMGDILAILREQITNDVDIKPQTRARYLQDVKYCETTWPDLGSLRPDEIGEDELRAWKNRAMTQGTGFRPPGSKVEATSGRSGRCFNGGLSVIRRALDIAMKHGAIHENVISAAARQRGKNKLRAKDDPKKPYAPAPETLNSILTEIEKGSGIAGWGLEVADFCRGIAYSGCRQAEAAGVTWTDVNFETGRLRIRGTKTESSERELPMSASLLSLFQRVLARRKQGTTLQKDGGPYVDPSERVFRVGEAQNSLDRACKALGVQRLTHHNLRDYFCTRALMSGVPIRVLAEWLGHADNGALLLKRYSHILAEDSAAQAAKLSLSV